MRIMQVLVGCINPNSARHEIELYRHRGNEKDIGD